MKKSLFVYTPGNTYEFAGPEEWVQAIWDELEKVTTQDEKGVTPMWVTVGGPTSKVKFRVPAITGYAMRPYEPSYSAVATQALQEAIKVQRKVGDSLEGGDEWKHGSD